jgi:hypothetical protein
MVLLKKALAILLALSLSLWAAGCGSTVTLVSYVDTDTYISSADANNHSELPYLDVSNTGGVEERALLKLPTGKEDQGYALSQIFGNLSDPLTWPLAPFVIVLDIFAAFFNCTAQTLSPANLVSSYLVLDVSQNAGGAALSQITIQHLAKPWWQTVNWTQAFPFTGASKAMWSQPGGDLDSTFTPIAGTAGSDGINATIQFDVTSYFKTLMASQNQPHYGFVMRSAGGAALSQVVLYSVQAGNQLIQPRLVSTYNCVPPSSGLQAQDLPAPRPYTYYLGPKR